MKKVVIVGGGFAGLSAAVHLANVGINVELFEASPKLGGRAYSFFDDITGDVIDNGQHILMGCYKETIHFLKLIGALNNIYYQDKLEINFVDKYSGVVPLISKSKFYPFNLLAGLLSYKAIKFTDRVNIIKFFLKLLGTPSESLNNLTVKELLDDNHQNDRTIKAFWDILVVGTLNTNLEKASAKIFIDILKKMFLKGNKSASILLPKTGLSEMYCNNASAFLNNHNGGINLSSRVSYIEIRNEKVKSVIVNNKPVDGFDFVVSAVPFHSFQKMFLDSDYLLSDLKFDYSPILTVHIWLNENPFKEKFYGLIDSKVHWIFNHGKHITIVISDAGAMIEFNSEKIYKVVVEEIHNYFAFFNNSLISNYKIIKEKRATFVPSPAILNSRPNANTKIKNLFLAGDWTNTGLPSTIEGAVKSGRIAAELIANEI